MNEVQTKIPYTYVTVRQGPVYRQMTLEEFLFGAADAKPLVIYNDANTKTYSVEKVPEKLFNRFDIGSLINQLAAFNEQTAELRARPRKELYREFRIPKRSGGLRKIDAPNDELMDALRRLKRLFEDKQTGFGALYHTSAFAYIKHRCTLDAVKKHQKNESKWFAKYDLHDFFGSTTLPFVMSMFSRIFPFSEVVKYERGKTELETALELAFLDGGLPQGTPISPLITNVMMIPVDFVLSNKLRKESKVYTRYADDFIISSRYEFDFRETEKYICEVLSYFGAPFSINAKKTRYGSSAGRNWNLGVMLNKNNEITVGHKKKKQLQTMLVSYIRDRGNGKPWDISDIQAMEGYRSYCRMIEGEVIDKIVEHINGKFNVDVVAMIKEDLAA